MPVTVFARYAACISLVAVSWACQDRPPVTFTHDLRECPPDSQRAGRDRAVRCAEDFVRQQGYTSQPAAVNSRTIAYEFVEAEDTYGGVLRARKGSLQAKAVGVCTDSGSFHVAFAPARDSFPEWGNAVTMRPDLTELRMAHQAFRVVGLDSIEGCVALRSLARRIDVDDGPEWYRHAVGRELTGDGRADSIMIRAWGPRYDSLRIVLSILVDGQEAYSTTWDSDYELIGAELIRGNPANDSLVRARLAATLKGVTREPLQKDDFRPSDYRAAAPIVEKASHQVSVTWGYESHQSLVWDSTSRQFLPFFSCC